MRCCVFVLHVVVMFCVVCDDFVCFCDVFDECDAFIYGLVLCCVFMSFSLCFHVF